MQGHQAQMEERTAGWWGRVRVTVRDMGFGVSRPELVYWLHHF